MLTIIAMLALGATLGAATRYYTTLWAAETLSRVFPYGTLMVNVVGSLLLGGFLTLANETPGISSQVRLLVGTGFCGSLTTFSTLSYEIVELLLAGRYTAGVLYAVGSLLLGLLGVVLGIALMRALLP
jgi:CrcB protein